MSREIKFRAWHNELKVMLYPPNNFDSMPYCRPHTKVMVVDSIHETSYESHLCAVIDWTGHWFHHGKLQDAILMQFTGLKDKNGVEIYEGDIVSWGKPPIELEERIAEVKINLDIQFDCKNISYPYVFHYGSFIYADTEKHLTVIGNIYEHPHLLTPTGGNEDKIGKV